jgi:hypothetical protein
MTLQDKRKELTTIISLCTLGTNSLILLELMREFENNCPEELKQELEDIIESLRIFVVGIHDDGVKRANVFLEETE